MFRIEPERKTEINKQTNKDFVVVSSIHGINIITKLMTILKYISEHSVVVFHLFSYFIYFFQFNVNFNFNDLISLPSEEI